MSRHQKKTGFKRQIDSSSTSSEPESLFEQRVEKPVDKRSKKQSLFFEDGSKVNIGRHQEHARPRGSLDKDSDSSATTASKTSLSSSITRFRSDFDDLKCKMKIFGESLSLCQCLASDFKNKLNSMEKRLQFLEKRQVIYKRENNYSAIIRKNRVLSNKTLADAKKLQMCGTEEEMREVAARICRNYLYGAWKTVEPSQLDFRRISGGLSNFLYYIALPDDARRLRGYIASSDMNHISEDLEKDRLSDSQDSGLFSKTLMKRNSSIIMDEPKKVLLRIYGQVHGERAMDAIVTESVIFTLLSERRLGPKLHGVFSGGRIEEYIPARPLLTKELSEPALSMKIAEKMAAIHSMDVPLSKEPSWLWKTMNKWLKTVKEERLATDSSKELSEEKIIKQLKLIDFDKEIEWLKKYIATVESPSVFCHNDMQEGNILMLEDCIHNSPDDDIQYCPTYEPITSDKENNHTNYAPIIQDDQTSDSMSSHLSDIGEPKLVLIDFEYCAYNYRGFDIANHFQEWAYDYTNAEHPFYYENQEDLPTLEQKEIFIKEYLKHYHSNLTTEEKAHEPSIDNVNRLLNEVDAFALASHLFWTLWSIVNASKSQIPFGYWEYGLSRVEMYKRLKQEVIKKEKFGGAQKRKICEVDI